MKFLKLALMATILTGCTTQYANFTQSISSKIKSPSIRVFNHLRSDQGLKDGVIELRKVRFQKWDKNVDGVITRNEVSDDNMKIPGVIDGFHSYDVNSNGKITIKEFLREDVIEFWMNLIRPKLEEQFAKHDKDRNRLITKEEQKKLKLFFSPWPKLNGGDLNKDGVITFSEYEDAYMYVLPFFQQGQEMARLPDAGISISNNQRAVTTIDVKEAHEWLADPNASWMVIDVRTPEEFRTGHLKNAQLMNFYDPGFRNQLLNMNRHQPYIIYCRSGNRSKKALNMMQELGFKNAYDIGGGIKAWRKAGYPTESV